MTLIPAEYLIAAVIAVGVTTAAFVFVRDGGIPATWRYRRELALLAALIYASHVTVFSWGVVAGLLAIPHTRNALERWLHTGRVRRQLRRGFQDAKVTARAGRVEFVPAGERVHVRLGRGCNQTKLFQAAETLKASLHVQDARVVGDTHDGSRAQITLVRRDPFGTAARAWPLADATQTDAWQPMPFAVDEDGELVLLALLMRDVGAQALLMGGVPGAGKSVTMNELVAYLALDTSIDLWLMDGKEELELKEWAPSAVALAGTKASALMMLRRLQAVMEDHYRRMGELAIKCITPDCGIRPQFLIVDELASFFLGADQTERKHAKELVELVRDIRARGRAAGVGMILATQRPDAETVNTKIRALVDYRLALRCTDSVSSDMILPGWSVQGVDASTIAIGQRGVGFLLTEGERPQRVRGFYTGAAGVTALAGRAAQRRAAAGRRPEEPGGETGLPVDPPGPEAPGETAG